MASVSNHFAKRLFQNCSRHSTLLSSVIRLPGRRTCMSALPNHAAALAVNVTMTAVGTRPCSIRVTTMDPAKVSPDAHIRPRVTLAHVGGSPPNW